MPHFLADDGEKIHLQLAGEATGSPIVFLHGWTSSHREWSPFAPQLAQRHALYRWDARGHGGHALHQPTPVTVSRMARDLHNLLNHYDLHNVTAVGHSMGALTLWQYLRDHVLHESGEQRLARLVLIDQTPRLLTDSDWQHGVYGDFDQQRNQTFVEELQQDFAEGVLRLTALGLNQRARQKYLEGHSGWEKSRQGLREQTPGPLIDCWRSLTAADYRDVLGQIPLPALLIFGGASNFYSTGTAQHVRDAIPNALLHIYENTDHSPHQWQRERFVQDVCRFIDDNAG
jgi:pimeloyl-ACP methyl ester carboxylesterase